MEENGAVRIGSMIRQRRLELGMTQAQLTEKVGLLRNQMQLSSIERGERKPRTPKSKYDKVLADIAGVLDITFDDDGNETRPIGDMIDDYNGSRTVFDRFRDIGVSVTKAWNAITGIDARVILNAADIMDLRAENKRLVEENSQIKHNVTALAERLMRLEKEMKNASQDSR